MNIASGHPSRLELFVSRWVRRLQIHIDRVWYPILVGFLAGIDALIVIIPTDGILISSALLAPRRWISLAVCVSVGSTLGGILVAYLVSVNGLPWILTIYPGLDQTQTWLLTQGFFEQYRLVLVFIIALSPFMQQPAVILASLAKVPLVELAFAMLLGRMIKYLLVSYLASHVPKLFKGRWGFD